ncbi:MAG: exosortase/archaeosortase family protein [Theionarchaea archaeon]|nr:exosortase/archaeosortase family protein [Theionarchaea archaeon]
MELNRLRSEPVQYVVRAAVYAAAVYVVASLLPVERITSQATAQFVTVLGMKAAWYQQNGHHYIEYLYISIDCTAMEIVALFIGMIMAAKAGLRRRVIFAVTGSAAVVMVNIGRIGAVYYLLEHDIPWVLAHDIFSGGLAIGSGMLFLLISERHLPQINQNLYALLDMVESAFLKKG